MPKLAGFPDEFSGWSKIAEIAVEPEVQNVLNADDVLNRIYASPDSRAAANLFVAYFESQRTGKAPHSPKNCLPGAGWTPSISDRVDIPVPGRDEPVRVNRYIVRKGDAESVVLYWYHSHNRVVASEYLAKVYLVWGSIRYNRSDASLVRVVVPVADSDQPEASRTAIQFVKAVYPTLRPYMP